MVINALKDFKMNSYLLRHLVLHMLKVLCKVHVNNARAKGKVNNHKIENSSLNSFHLKVRKNFSTKPKKVQEERRGRSRNFLPNLKYNIYKNSTCTKMYPVNRYEGHELCQRKSCTYMLKTFLK